MNPCHLKTTPMEDALCGRRIAARDLSLFGAVPSQTTARDRRSLLALQAAARGMDDGADDELVLAAALHDIGHSPLLGGPGVHDHSGLAAAWLAERFGDRVAWLAGAHVAAKRHLAAVDPAHIGYAQLNDTTLQPRLQNYMEEAMFERMVPGEGELPLHELLSALPADIVIEIEVPRRSLALDGVSPIDRMRPCVDAARRLLSELGQ